jgi:hypothetical protein
VTRIVKLRVPPGQAWDRLKTAATSIGKIEEAHDSSLFLTVKARYGLHAVRLRVSVLSGSTGATSVLDVESRGQLRLVNRKVIDRLCAAL